MTEYSSPPPAASNTVNKLPPRTQRKSQSRVWDHFTPNPESTSKRDKCNHCQSSIKCDNGTSSMLAHSKTCYNAEQVSTSTTENVEGHVSSSPSLVKFDQERCHRELVKMLIVMELPFRLVEHKAFIKFSSILQPRFNVTSHAILTHDILTLWDIEKIKLKNFLSQHCQRVCLTTDAWTSNQNLSYMCLTAHFIDNNWKLHKKILNFG